MFCVSPTTATRLPRHVCWKKLSTFGTKKYCSSSCQRKTGLGDSEISLLSQARWKISFRMMLMSRPVSWPYSSIGKSQITILPSRNVCSGVKVHLPLQKRRLKGLKMNLLPSPDHIISSDERGRSSKSGQRWYR